MHKRTIAILIIAMFLMPSVFAQLEEFENTELQPTGVNPQYRVILNRLKALEENQKNMTTKDDLGVAINNLADFFQSILTNAVIILTFIMVSIIVLLSSIYLYLKSTRRL